MERKPAAVGVASRRALTREIRFLKNRNTYDAESEATWERWQVKGSSLTDYARSFEGIFPNKSLKNAIKEKVEKGEAWILDLMADDTVITEAVGECGYKGGLAVSLGFPPSAERKGIGDPDPNVGSLNGDLLSAHTWAEIRQWMTRAEIDSFDFIVSRPEGGLANITDDPRVQLMLLRKAWSLLSTQNGKLVFQVSHRLMEYFVEYAKQLEEAGIMTAIDNDINDTRPTALMIKTPDLPAKLPSPDPIFLNPYRPARYP